MGAGMKAVNLTLPNNFGIHSITESIKRVEELVTSVVSLTFFTRNQNLGRVLLVTLAILSPRTASFGILGLLLTYGASFAVSRNETQRISGVFGLNGWYLGLACAYFYPDNRLSIFMLAGLSPVCAFASVVMERFLRLWGLHQLVLPYVIAIWFVQLLSLANPELKLIVPAGESFSSHSHLILLLVGSLKGYGQIFLQDDIRFSIAILAVLGGFRILPFWNLILAPILATTVSLLVLGPHWAISSGLTSFGAIMLGAAFDKKYITLTTAQFLILIGVSGLLEIVAIQIAGFFHLFALSAGYVGSFWIASLATESTKVDTRELDSGVPW